MIFKKLYPPKKIKYKIKRCDHSKKKKVKILQCWIFILLGVKIYVVIGCVWRWMWYLWFGSSPKTETTVWASLSSHFQMFQTKNVIINKECSVTLHDWSSASAIWYLQSAICYLHNACFSPSRLQDPTPTVRCSALCLTSIICKCSSLQKEVQESLY